MNANNLWKNSYLLRIDDYIIFLPKIIFVLFRFNFSFIKKVLDVVVADDGSLFNSSI